MNIWVRRWGRRRLASNMVTRTRASSSMYSVDMTLARAMPMGNSFLSPWMVIKSTSRSNLSASTVSARVSNSVPCCSIWVSTSMNAALVWASRW
ncbi:hypothetical protein BpHYR1_050691 [Brachionus plicatilis]|uniref:Uncharacterized protein n=1 Tax=Brachionus plicatilis TaxID=10195 RepID=A0A3M7RB19_BRAPC|nr:hypothetical protein BpHYR1_050691 [Brachionus plicatilis]